MAALGHPEILICRQFKMMTNPILLATTNAGKIRELKEMLGGVEILSLKDVGFFDEIEETGETFLDNALIKARAVYAAVRDKSLIVLADDSGLEIDWLDKRPGVQSARFMGEYGYGLRNAYLIGIMKDVPDAARSARFVCAMAAVMPDGTELTAVETFEGRVARSAREANGFGYDPIFYVPEYGMTSAEMPPELKNSLSHRGKALRSIVKKIYA